MVQLHISPIETFKYPFELVIAAYEMRFPTCPQFPIVAATEIVDETHSDDRNEWFIERLCKLNIEVPYLLKRAAGLDFFCVRLKNTLNRRQRSLRIEATNISFPQRLKVEEFCNYYVHPENKNWTCFSQRASLDVKSFFGFESTVEKIAVKQFADNQAKSKAILEHFIRTLVNSGFDHFPMNDSGDGDSE